MCHEIGDEGRTTWGVSHLELFIAMHPIGLNLLVFNSHFEIVILSLSYSVLAQP